MKILVTGTLGFIGSNFIRSVTKTYPQYSWIGVDSAVYDYCLFNMFEYPNYKFYLADIANEHIIDRIFRIERPDLVINFASESFVCSSIEKPNPFIYSNVLGAQTLINSAVKYEVKRFLQISTDEVFGSHNSISDLSWTEESPPSPNNPYSASKLSAENMLIAAHKTHKLNYNITRCCNVYGPRQPSNRNLIPKIIRNTLNNIPMPIYGNGTHMREYLHVEDKIAALITVLEKGNLNQIYNIGSGIEVSNTDMVNKIAKLLNKEPNINYTTDRKSHDWRYSINCNKLKTLGWAPKSFEEGIKNTIEWYKTNKNY